MQSATRELNHKSHQILKLVPQNAKTSKIFEKCILYFFICNLQEIRSLKGSRFGLHLGDSRTIWESYLNIGNAECCFELDTELSQTYTDKTKVPNRIAIVFDKKQCYY